MRSCLIPLVLAASAAAAEAPMTAEEFDAYTQGRTLTYSAAGVVYGIEEYLPDRRVRWAYIGDTCQEGSWYPVGDMICFVYEDFEQPQCWSFYRRESGLEAVFMNDPESLTLYETRQSPEPLQCPGPKVGV